VTAVAGDPLQLALDEVATAREVKQRARNQHRDQSAGADHRQPAGIYYHSLPISVRGPAARRAYTAVNLTKNHTAAAAASAAPKINNR
jgi:hypothetical protein